tara:strand:+ start:2423 stop:3868 length:1446 start_codon:yes stop_codon:yes gene_type:complete
MTESTDDLSKLALAFDRANNSITRTGQAFGELAESSKEWTVVSRILSGTGAWRLQNQIRAIGQTINIFHKRQEEATKSTIEAIDANVKLAESFKDIQDARNKLAKGGEALENDPIFSMFSGTAGVDAVKEYGKYLDLAESRLNKAKKGVGVAIRKAALPDAATDFMRGGFFADEKGEGGVVNFMKQSRQQFMSQGLGRHFVRGGGGLRDIGMARDTSGEVLNKTAFGDRKMYRQRMNNIAKKLSPIAGKIGQYFVIGTFALSKFLIYFLAIITGFALLVFIVRKMKIGTKLKAFEKRFGIFGDIFANIKEILTSVFNLFKAAFGGDGQGFKKALKEFAIAVGTLLKNILKLLLVSFLQVVKFLVSGLVTVIGKIIGKIPLMGGVGKSIVNVGKDIRGMATGGVSSGGLTLVGERGPELVRLPSGARVHSNAESRRMGGGTINVHVNGRVGASDAEIRDIASKVAREINTQMNRQAHTVGRF